MAYSLYVGSLAISIVLLSVPYSYAARSLVALPHLDVEKYYCNFHLETNLKNTSQLIKEAGYPAEEHTVTTEDGYILSIQRMPNGIRSRSECQGLKVPEGTPVLVMHGLLLASNSWVFNGADLSLAFTLADCGYDVWLLNFRGSTYSLGHTTLACKQAYWNFTFEQCGTYDLPAAIDHVLIKTGHERLYLIGHSMGGTASLILFAMRPEYNTKVIACVGLAPQANLTNSHNILVTTPKLLELIFKVEGPFLWKDNLINFFASYGCKGPIYKGCEALFFALVGKENSTYYDEDRLHIYLGYFPSVASNGQIRHFAQNKNLKNFSRLDHGKKANEKLYHQKTPPAYNLSNFRVPILVISGTNDILVASQDTLDLVTCLEKNPGLLVKHTIIPFYTHLDFCISKTGPTDYHFKMIKQMSDWYK